MQIKWIYHSWNDLGRIAFFYILDREENNLIREVTINSTVTHLVNSALE